MVMQILPSLAEAHIEGFAAGITQLQNSMGDHFAKAQGGRYTSPRVARILHWLAAQGLQGYGQSSWGPTGFLVVKDQLSAEKILRTIQNESYSQVKLTLCRGQNTGGSIRFR
jgi:beta-ribofuranosylaminobenzene 5'-phosphate synthase